jgi:hypothetical protein
LFVICVCLFFFGFGVEPGHIFVFESQEKLKRISFASTTQKKNSICSSLAVSSLSAISQDLLGNYKHRHYQTSYILTKKKKKEKKSRLDLLKVSQITKFLP